ncbi:hypothetical protein TNCV_1002791 [Trichonephila clavipes]|nr:hypothetical protein TNCV_1002791 [Trichonephila clavipes]
MGLRIGILTFADLVHSPRAVITFFSEAPYRHDTNYRKESSHYQPPMNPPYPGLATGRRWERVVVCFATLVHFLPYGITPPL